MACAKLNDTRIQLNNTQSQLKETQLQLRDAQHQLNDSQLQLRDAQHQLNDSQLQLRDAQHQLNDSQLQLRDAQHQLNDSQLQLRDAQHQLNDSQLQLTDAQRQLNDTQRQLSNTQQEFKETKTKLEEKVSALESPSLIQISGILTWKICGVEEKMKQATSGEKTDINSPPFYDHGYKFGLTLEFNNTFLLIKFVSVRFFLMKGEYDAVLSWPLPNKKVTITWIDQQEDPRKRKSAVALFELNETVQKDCLKRVENDGNQRPVSRFLLSHGNITERRYVVDDTIFIQIQIDPA